LFNEITLKPRCTAHVVRLYFSPAPPRPLRDHSRKKLRRTRFSRPTEFRSLVTPHVPGHTYSHTAPTNYRFSKRGTYRNPIFMSTRLLNYLQAINNACRSSPVIVEAVPSKLLIICRTIVFLFYNGGRGLGRKPRPSSPTSPHRCLGSSRDTH
jgi:hypothetical protein